MSDPLLDLLRRSGRRSHAELAEQLALDVEAVSRQIAQWEADGTIVGYQAVVDAQEAGDERVSAFIEVKLTPERGEGFDLMARRISRFDQVTSCYLSSGGYDLMVVVEASSLLEVARFVSEKLSTVKGVLSTATHFRLKTYKENGFLFGGTESNERLLVSP